MGDEVLPWRFIEAGTVTVSNEYPEADTPAEAQFLAVSNRYGFTAIYTWKSHLLFAKTARLFDLAKTKADLLETPAADVFQAPVKGFVKGLYLSGDELVLALAKRRSVLFFSAKALEHKDPTPLGKVRICASKEESVTQLSWHPVVPNLLLVLSSKGKVTLIDSTTKRSYDWGAGLPGDIVSLTWSSSGKSVLCGGKSGDVLCVNKDGQLRAKFPKPDSAFSGEECEAHQVVPISGRTIGVAYRPVENPGDSMFYLMDLPKELTGEAKMTQVNYLGMPNPQRTSLYHFGQVKDWKLLMVGGSNFAEIEVVSTESTESTAGDEPLDPLSLNDSFRAQVPMRAQGDDNHLIGLAFDFTKSDPMPDPTNSDRTPFAPSPVLFLLIDEGKLIAYVFVKTNLPKDETLKLPFMTQPAPIPATQTLDPLASKPDLVPSVALSASADGAGASTPLSPSAQRNSLRQASHGLGTAAKPTAPSTSTPVPVAGGSASFTFGAPPGAGASAFSFSALAPAATTKPEDTATKPSIFSFGAPSGSTTAPAGAALPAFSFEPAKPAADVPGASTFSLGTSASAASKKPPAFSFAPSGSAKAPAGAAPPAFSFEPAKPAADMPGAGASTFSFAPAATKKPEEATTKPPSFSFGGSSGSAGAAPPAFAFEPAKPAADMPKPSPLGLAGKPTTATPPLSFTPGDAPSSDAPPAKRRQPTAEPSKPISFQPPAATPTSRAAVAAAAGPKITLPAPTMAEPRITAPTPVVATAARPKITTPAPAPVTAAEPKPREPVARRPVVGEGGDARDLQNQFIEHIASFEQVLDEVRAAERETAKLMHKIENGPATPGEFTQAGLVRLRKRTDQLVDDINAITEQNLQQQRTRKQVHDDYMEAVGLYTDADSLFHAKTDKQYQLLLNNRKLDAESAAMRKNIQKLSADVEIKMAEVETHLQRMWNVQRRKEKKAMRVPVGDTLYRTLKSYDEIAQRQAIQLQDLSEEFEKLRMQSEYASTLSLGLAVSSSRTASPAGKKSPFAREQRRERNGEEEDGTPRRVRDSGLEQLGTLNGKEYTERMKELKKIISQRSWQQPQESRMAGTPTTPSSASSSSSFVGAVPVRADKPAPPQFGGNGEKNAAASTTKPLGRWDQPSAKSSPPPAAAASFSFAPSTADSAAQASSFSFGASLTAGDKSKAAKPLGRSDQPPATSSPAPSFSFAPSAAGSAAPASSFSFAPSAAGSAAQASSFSFGASLTAGDKPKAGAPLTTATTPDKGTTASAGGFGGGSFSLPSFNVPETKPISVSSPTSPPQRLVPVNLVAGYSRSESDEEDDEEDDEEGPYDEESEEGEDEDDDDEYPDEDDEEDEYPDLGPSSGSKLGTLPVPASTKPSGADSLFDFKPLPNPLATVAADVRPPGEFSFGPSVAPITSGTSKGKPATAVDAEPASSGLTLGVAGTPKQLAKSPVAKSLFSSADDTPATFSFAAAAPSASSAPSLSSASTASTSSAETSTPAASSSSAPAFSLSSAPAAATSSAAAAPSFTFPSTTTAAAPEKPAASPAAFTAFAPTAAASTPATGSTSTPAPAPFGAFSFASGGDKPATSGLASSAPASVSSGSALGSFSFASGGDKPASSAPAAVSSGSALGSFSFSSAPAGATSAAPAAASPFGSFSFASTPATGGAAAPAAAAPAAAAASTGASPFGSFSFSSTPTASAPAAGAGATPFGAASASAPAASTGSLFGGLSLGTSQPASSPAANPFGSGLSTSTPGAGSTSSPFGAPSASSAAPAASPFGASAASTPASGGMSLFGATSSLPTLASSLSTPTFGSTSAFGTPAATSSPFGAAASAAPAFGAPAFGQPAFGAPSPLSGSAGGGFGTPAFGSVSPFGATAASAAPAAGGQQRTFGSGFGSAASGTGGGGFASFASGTGGGGFASIASGTGGGFGAAANTGGFGGASAGTGGGGFSSLLPSTGASPFGAAPAGDVWGAIRK